MTSLGSIVYAAEGCTECAYYAPYQRACSYHEAYGEGLEDGLERAAGERARLEAELADLRAVSVGVAPHADTLVAQAPGHLFLHPGGLWGPPGTVGDDPCAFASVAEAEAAIALAKPWWETPGWKERAGLSVSSEVGP